MNNRQFSVKAMRYQIVGACIISAVITACANDPNRQQEFDFPMELGNIEEGRQAFIGLGCHQCHTVANTELPDFPTYPLLRLELGGPTDPYMSNARLMTSLINPNQHVSERLWDLLRLDGSVPLESPMPNFDFITVSQLIDLVAFLDSKY